MSTIYFGNISQLANYSDSGSIGWNDSQAKFWGNTADDTLTTANSTMALALTSNNAWSIYGGGGADTISFASYANAGTTGLSFNLSQLITTGSSTSTFAVIGSGNNDLFNWSGAATSTNNVISIDGGLGADTLSIQNSTTGREINLYGSIYQNIEYLIGSGYADTLRGTTVAETIDGAAGADLLWGGDGSYSDKLIGGAGADTYYYSFNQGTDTIADGTTSSANDVVKLSDLNFADLTFGASGNDGVIGFKTSTGYTGTLILDEFTEYDNTSRVHTFVTNDKTFGLEIANTTSSSLSGSTLSDYMLGSDGNDTLVAGAGDSLYGGANNDLLRYFATASVFDGGANGADGDTLSAATATTGATINLYDSGFANIEVLVGSSLADVLRGDSLGNTLSGGIGADQLWGGSGTLADVLKGGAGADTFWYYASQGNDTIAVEPTLTDSANDVVKLSGVNFADLTFSVSNSNDALISFKTSTGYSGNLTIDEWLASANGSRLNYFATDDKTFGLALANDSSTSLTGTTLSDYMLGGVGNDTLVAGAGDSLYGGANNDLLKYFATASVFDGGANGADGDTLSASTATVGADISLYDSAFANIEILEGSSLADVLRGSTISNTLYGGAGADQLWGGTNTVNDTLYGGLGADTFWFYSGQGNDVIGTDSTASYSASDAVRLSGINFSDITFAAANGNDAQITFKSSTGYTGALTITNWIGAGSNTSRLNYFVTDDKTFGLALANDASTSLTGTSLSDILQGGAGNDTLTAGAGDSLYGGAGADFLKYLSTATIFDGGANVADGDTLSAATATVGIDLNLYDSNVMNIEVLEGSSLADIMRGDTLANTLIGGYGADNLWGNKGADSLMGGYGADTFWFGANDGADTIGTEAAALVASDVVKFKDLSFSSLSFALANSEKDLQITISGDTASSLTLAEWGIAGTTTGLNSSRITTFVTDDKTFGVILGQTAASSTLSGTTLADWIVGGSAADSISGSSGADSIYAQAGDDVVVYKATAFSVDGGDGTDTISAASASAAVDIDLRNVNTAYTNFSNIEIMEGSQYNDILRGTTGAETLIGGYGSDALWGAGGADQMTGGEGTDSYWFGGTDGADTVTSSTTNSADYVVFSSINGSQISGNDLRTVELSGNNLVITLTSGDSLTVADWNSGSAYKLNKFNFGTNGTYSLAFDGSGVATWTKLS